MKRFRISAKPSASKEFDALPPAVRRRFTATFEALETDPFLARTGLDIRPLEGRRHEWRLRIGHYRGIFVVEGDAVRFLRFGHRSTVYR